MLHVPLRRQREVVVADLLEVPLLPFRPVDERDVVGVNVSSGSAFVRSGMMTSGCSFGSVTTLAMRVFDQRA
jgi:hypothetical protein